MRKSLRDQELSFEQLGGNDDRDDVCCFLSLAEYHNISRANEKISMCLLDEVSAPPCCIRRFTLDSQG